MWDDEIKNLRDILNKMDVDVIRNGMKTFTINGTNQYVHFGSCFVAMMYGKEDEFSEDNFPFGLLAKRVCLTTCDLEILSHLHYNHPVKFKQICEEFLEQKEKAI